MENGQSTAAKLGLPPLTPEQQEALQKVSTTGGYLLFGGGGVVWVFNEPLSVMGPKGTHHGISEMVTMLRGPTVTFGLRSHLFGFEFTDTFGSMMGNHCCGG